MTDLDMDIMHNRYATNYESAQYGKTDSDGIHRYLFLDIDGVLNTMRYSNYLIDHDEDDTDEDGALFDPEAVENLAEIINNIPDVKIIISIILAEITALPIAFIILFLLHLTLK